METLTLGQVSLTLAFLVALIGSVSFLMARTKAWILKAVKDELGKLDGKIEETAKKLDEMNDSRERNRADSARRTILGFNDELLRGLKHSKEAFDQALRDVDDYEHYSNTHPEYPNNQARFAIENIKKCYQSCVDSRNFLS